MASPSCPSCSVAHEDGAAPQADLPDALCVLIHQLHPAAPGTTLPELGVERPGDMVRESSFLQGLDQPLQGAPDCLSVFIDS